MSSDPWWRTRAQGQETCAAPECPEAATMDLNVAHGVTESRNGKPVEHDIALGFCQSHGTGAPDVRSE